MSLTKVDFTTRDAVRILRRLGFDTIEGTKREKRLSSFAGILSLGGNSVKESGVWYE